MKLHTSFFRPVAINIKHPITTLYKLPNFREFSASHHHSLNSHISYTQHHRFYSTFKLTKQSKQNHKIKQKQSAKATLNMSTALTHKSVNFIPKSSLLNNVTINNFDELQDLLLEIQNTVPHKKTMRTGKPFTALEEAITQFEKHIQSNYNQTDFSFSTHLLPSIISTATLAEYNNLSIPLSLSSQPSTIELTAAQIQCILANSFLLHLTAIPVVENKELTDLPKQIRKEFGDLDWTTVYTEDAYDGVAIARIQCQLMYFYLTLIDKSDWDENRTVKFERICLASDDQVADNLSDDQKQLTSGTATIIDHSPLKPPNWSTSNTTWSSSLIHSHSQSMTDSPARCFVDFANKRLQIHCMIASATQEEVLFSCCPEAQLSMLFCHTMLDTEVIVMKNVQRFSNTTGYAETFEFAGAYHSASDSSSSSTSQFEHNASPSIINILALDACTHQHFTSEMVSRDLNKAWLAFTACKDEAVSTGKWGCGIFVSS